MSGPLRIKQIDAEHALERLFSLVPKIEWKERASELLRSWPHLDNYDHLAVLHESELAVGRAAGIHDFSGSFCPVGLDEGAEVALEFAYLAMRLVDATDASVQIGRAISGHLANTRSSLRPFRFELDTYSYGLQRGFEVVPTDILGLARYDFMMRKGGTAIAVECKHVTGDAGMVIERRQAFELFDRIIGFAQRRHISLDNMKVLLAVPGRLEQLNQIAQSVCEVISGRIACIREMPSVTVEFARVDPSESHALRATQDGPSDVEAQHSLVNRALGLDRSNHLYLRSRNDAVTVLAVSSSARTNQAERIFKRLIDDAKKQLPNDMPGAMMVELQDLLPEDADFFSRRDNNDLLKQKVFELFNRRPWVHGVTFVAGSRRQAAAGAPPRSGERPTLVFKNPGHPLAGDADINSLYAL